MLFVVFKNGKEVVEMIDFREVVLLVVIKDMFYGIEFRVRWVRIFKSINF